MLKRQLADALNASKRKGSGTSNPSTFLALNLSPGGWNTTGGSMGGYSDDSENEDSVAKALLDQLAESEKLVQQMSLTWEEKVELSEAITKVSPESFELIPSNGEGLSVGIVGTFTVLTFHHICLNCTFMTSL